MRLSCPDCDAQYQVEDALIPPEGRTVECARCGHRWHQAGAAPAPILLGDPDTSPEVAPEVAPEPPAGPAPPSASTPRPSEQVLAILREEAERELAQRAADRTRATARREAQDAPAAPVADPEDHPAPQTPPTHDPEFVVAELVEDHELPGHAPSSSSSSRALPDPDALAASLHWRTARAAPPSRWGRDAGFAVAVAAALLAGGAYVAAPRLADAGVIGTALADYRRGADRARLWLFDRAAPLTDRAIGLVKGEG